MIAKIYLKNDTSTIKEFTNLCHKLYNISYLAIPIVVFDSLTDILSLAVLTRLLKLSA